MRECEFLSIDKYKTNIENYNTQLKYECGVFLVLFFLFLFCFFLGWVSGPFYHYHSLRYCYPTCAEVGVVANTL